MADNPITLQSPISPDYCQVFLNVGDMGSTTSFTPIPPQYLISFNHKILPGFQSTASITLFDFTGLVLESSLNKIGIANQTQYIYFYYGLVKSGIFSDVYKMLITNYTPTFMNGGIQIQLDLMSISILKLSTIDYIKNFPKCEGKLTKFIKSMCDLKGIQWDEKSIDGSDKPLYADKSNKRLMNFHTGNGSVAQTIRKYIPLLSNEKGERNWTYYYDDTQNGKLYMHPSNVGNPDSPTVDIKYEVYGPKSQLVLNFSPTYNGMLLYAIAGGQILSYYFDPKNNTLRQDVVKRDQESPEKGKSEMTMTVRKMSSLDASNSLASIQNTKEWMNAFLFNATMDVYGYYRFNLFQMLDIAVYVNANGIYSMGADGKGEPGGLHYSSGRYMIKGISYNYSGGRIIASLDLMRNPSGDRNAKTTDYTSVSTKVDSLKNSK